MAETSDVIAERETNTDEDKQEDNVVYTDIKVKSGKVELREELRMKRLRLQEYRDVLQKLDRDRDLHDVERRRLG